MSFQKQKPTSRLMQTNRELANNRTRMFMNNAIKAIC